MIAQYAVDIDSDGYYELPASEVGGKLPVSVNAGTLGTDEWGSQVLYCPYDLGISNTVDSSYVSSSPAYPSSHAAAMVVSAGRDGVMQTTCADTVAKEDDIAVFVTESEIRYAKGGMGGFTHTNGEVTLVTSTDNVNISQGFLLLGNFPDPLPLVDAQSRALRSGTIAFNTTKKRPEIFDGTKWLSFSGGSNPFGFANTTGYYGMMATSVSLYYAGAGEGGCQPVSIAGDSCNWNSGYAGSYNNGPYLTVGAGWVKSATICPGQSITLATIAPCADSATGNVTLTFGTAAISWTVTTTRNTYVKIGDPSGSGGDKWCRVGTGCYQRSDGTNGSGGWSFAQTYAGSPLVATGSYGCCDGCCSAGTAYNYYWPNCDAWGGGPCYSF